MKEITMASLAASIFATPSQDGWISPQEQLERLAFIMAEEQLETNKAKFKTVPKLLIDRVTECAAQSILKCSNLSPYNIEEHRIPKLTDIAIGCLIELSPLPPILTHWYTARDRLMALPEKLPPLPRNIHAIVNGKCPIYDTQIKPDGTYYRVRDTHFLQLLCQEDGNLHQFEQNVLKPYGEKHYPKGRNPFRLLYLWLDVYQEYGEIPYESTHWELMTKDVLPESRDTSCKQQDALIAFLRNKALVNYEFPSVKNVPRALFLHKVATGESLYRTADAQNGHRYTYTSVQESSQDWRLVVGGFSPIGLSSGTHFFCGDSVGVAALRKF
jgi:hypothetical protein